MLLERLSRERFNALCYSRQPAAHIMSEEVEWWTDPDERVLGLVARDTTDDDWLWIVLGRDEKALFRCIDIHVSIETQEAAREQLHHKLESYSASGETEFPQHDTDDKKNRLLVPVVSDEKLHRNFKLLVTGPHHSSAREIIREIAYAFVDVDGNYARDFQTSGFNARLWELFLFAFLYEQKCHLPREFNRPDYHAIKWGFPFAIEAVTVNPTHGEAAPNPQTDAETRELRRDYMPIKFGSALFSKLKKKYWELPHMRGVPFLIAIHDFHGEDSMTWSAPALEDYLYGVRASWTKDDSGTLHVTENSIGTHAWRGKSIPSGFFDQPMAEHVSAVLFSNSATLSKFNRMGKLAGFGDPTVEMLRVGVKHRWDPNATEPLPFSVRVQPGEYTETWSDSVRVFHNPSALNPIPNELFDGCSQQWFKDGRRVTNLIQHHVYASRTMILAPQAG
jgi:hypothetical protein